MTNKFLEDDLYTAQHYGLTATGFVTYLYRALAVSLDQGLNELEEKVLSQMTAEKEDVKSKLKNLREKVMEYFSKRMDHYFDFLEAYLRDVLTIPDNLVLPQDQVHQRVDYCDEKDQDADRQIKEKRMRLRGIYNAKVALVRELKELKDTQDIIGNYLNELQILRSEEQTQSEFHSPLNLGRIFEDVKALQRSVAAVEQIRNVSLPR